ncbi:MAG TPA: bifunctional 3'-5' exonuclease/DNA polymerase [Candidatus Limiplasma sp.]|nr:bifunctional 3'-5' exonuclease/DNA polymerase [Candidatus Limiplasma sp.]
MDYQCMTDVQAIQAYLAEAAVVAFDFETAPLPPYRSDPKAALDAHRSQIVGISLSVAEDSGIYVPLWHIDGGNANVNSIISFLCDAVWTNPQVIKVAHNLAFESMFLYALGIVLQPPCYDTMAAAQLTLKSRFIFRQLSDCGLKTLVPELLNVELPSFEMVTGGKYFDELPSYAPETVRYACADSDFALRLYHCFNAWFTQYLPEHHSLVETVESPTAVYCGLMKYNGLLMNKSSMIQKQVECMDKLLEVRHKIRDLIGDVDIGANANTQAFKRYLFEDLKLPVLKTTAKSKEAADDQALIMLSEWCTANRPELVPLFELIQEYRKWSKLKTTYIDGYLKHLNPATGRIHPDLLPLATETGRFASRNPNFQNCPRKTNDPVGIRSFIVAPEGHVLVSCDFSQIELRVGAFYCRDDRMLETYRNNGDIHAQTTSVIYRIPYTQAADKQAAGYKERRTIAKNVNFGVFYGLFPRGLQRTLRFKAGLHVSLPECETIIDSLKAGYPLLTHWQEQEKRNTACRHYTETFLGRRRYLPDIRSQDWGKRSFAERCALNTPIQGTAADILKLALGQLLTGLSERPWLKPLLQIHDELVFELPEERIGEAVDFIRGCMEQQPFPAFDVPILAEAAYGTDFGHMTEIDR